MSKSPYRAMRDLEQQMRDTYGRLLVKILARVQQYAARYLIDFAKAERPPYQPLVTPQVLADIRRIVSDYHAAFIATQLGRRLIEPMEVQRLIDNGTLPQDLAYLFQATFGEANPPEAAQLIAEAYNFGVLLGSSPERAGIAAMARDKVAEHPLPDLTPQERAARDFAEHHAANVIVGLGNRVADDMTTTMIEADSALRDEYQRDIRGELDMNIARRDAWRKLASELGHKSSDWARDFGRIAATEKAHALQEGLVASLVDREGDPRHVRVAKLPTPAACSACVRLHLTAGKGSPPRIFKLSTLIANGSNRGRKQKDWRAIVGPSHPFCECELVHVPNGWAFDDEGNLAPESLRRSALLVEDMRKAGGNLTYGRVVPARGVVVAIQDPWKRAAIERVVAETPREIFDARVGVTFITHDAPRVDNPMTEHDLAYWTGNEIRIATTLPLERIDEVMRHELGHSLNVYLMYRWRGTEPVVRWHNKLYRVSRSEGFVSKYAMTAPIENAAELTRMYLYQRRRLVLNCPRQFAMLDAAYREIWRPRDATSDSGLRPVPADARPGEAARQRQDRRDRRQRRGARL